MTNPLSFLAPAIAALHEFDWIGETTHVVKLGFIDSLLSPVFDALEPLPASGIAPNGRGVLTK